MPPVPYGESDAFLGGGSKGAAGSSGGDGCGGCMRSKGCCGCCVVLAIVGVLFVALGIVVIVIGPDMLVCEQQHSVLQQEQHQKQKQ